MLQAVSYLAPNWFGFYQAVIDALARSLNLQIQLRQGEFDPLDDPILLHDQLDLAFICGLPFIRYHRTKPHQLQVLAVPVLNAPRYDDRPIYFSDVIVSRHSEIKCFSDLAGKSFCYNDPGSNSGYHLVRWYVSRQGYNDDFFGSYLQSGSHQRSLQWVVEGQADWAAIDSTVLEQALQVQPQWGEHIRVITAIGPSPMPPLVAATHLGMAVIQNMQKVLLQPDPTLQAAMAIAEVNRYVLQSWQDYEIFITRYDIA